MLVRTVHPGECSCHPCGKGDFLQTPPCRGLQLGRPRAGLWASFGCAGWAHGQGSKQGTRRGQKRQGRGPQTEPWRWDTVLPRPPHLRGALGSLHNPRPLHCSMSAGPPASMFTTHQAWGPRGLPRTDAAGASAPRPPSPLPKAWLCVLVSLCPVHLPPVISALGRASVTPPRFVPTRQLHCTAPPSRKPPGAAGPKARSSPTPRPGALPLPLGRKGRLSSALPTADSRAHGTAPRPRARVSLARASLCACHRPRVAPALGDDAALPLLHIYEGGDSGARSLRLPDVRGGVGGPWSPLKSSQREGPLVPGRRPSPSAANTARSLLRVRAPCRRVRSVALGPGGAAWRAVTPRGLGLRAILLGPPQARAPRALSVRFLSPRLLGDGSSLSRAELGGFLSLKPFLSF